METILALLGGAIAAGAAFGFKKLGAALFLSKYGKIIEKTFAVVDPIMGDLVKSYDGSTVQQALELAVYRVSDSDLSEEDALAITNFIVEKFSPSMAATAVLDAATPEGKASLEIAEKIGALTDGVSKSELVDLVRSAAALV